MRYWTLIVGFAVVIALMAASTPVLSRTDDYDLRVASLPPVARHKLAPSGIPLDVAVFDPTPVLAEGKRHLVYELHLTNFGRTPLTLERVEAVDDGSDAALAVWFGAALSGMIYQPGGAGAGGNMVIEGGRQAIIFVDLIGSASDRLPRAISHRFTFRPVRTENRIDEQVLDAGVVTPHEATDAPFGPPVEGGCWVASHGLSNESSHRRTLLAINGKARIAQRFAIDWIRVGPDGQAFRGDPSNNSNWTPYGSNVLAIAAGTVVEVLDGVPENDPTADTKAVPITLTTVGGNHLLIKVGSHRYVFYAHLRPGSIRVKVGDRVARGQRVGQLGNSGQSDAPHLHIHLVDSASPLAAEGLPLSFDRFKVQGHLPSLKPLVDGSGWRQTMPPIEHHNEMPVENAVVAFTGPGTDCRNDWR